MCGGGIQNMEKKLSTGLEVTFNIFNSSSPPSLFLSSSIDAPGKVMFNELIGFWTFEPKNFHVEVDSSSFYSITSGLGNKSPSSPTSCTASSQKRYCRVVLITIIALWHGRMRDGGLGTDEERCCATLIGTDAPPTSTSGSPLSYSVSPRFLLVPRECSAGECTGTFLMFFVAVLNEMLVGALQPLMMMVGHHTTATIILIRRNERPTTTAI